MDVLGGVLWSLGLLGHAGIWATVFNQIHATACPRNSRKLSEKLVLVLVFLPIALVATEFLPWQSCGFEVSPLSRAVSQLPATAVTLGWLYGVVCVPVGLLFTLRWLIRKWRYRVPGAVTNLHQTRHDLRRELNGPLLHGWFARALGWLPFNQVLQLDVNQLELTLDIPAELDGFRICHLSDLHFTGQIDPRYFQRIIEIANRFEPHLTVITGDLLDKDQCIDWLPETLGKLRAELGCYFILGNHDLLINDQDSYLNRLAETGLRRVHGDWNEIQFGRVAIRIAGNELPWYHGAEKLPILPAAQPNEFRLLLTHSPDQVHWAAAYDFDLILAGHTHGGQIRFPLIGAVIVPSRYGVKYACGPFETKNSFMYVSRGIAGDEPLRIGCPPELGLVTVRSLKGEGGSLKGEG